MTNVAACRDRARAVIGGVLANRWFIHFIFLYIPYSHHSANFITAYESDPKLPPANRDHDANGERHDGLLISPVSGLCRLESARGVCRNAWSPADGQDERRIEELHKRRNFLAAYCKLIVYNVAPIRRAADVFKHYIKASIGRGAGVYRPRANGPFVLQCYNDYGDIIKATLSKAREINKLSCALTMQLAMQALYGALLQRHAAPHRQLPELLELKELAKRFSVMFGLDAVKNREALTALHRAGVSFAALDPRHLLFLEPLAELSNKLLRQDKRHVLKFLDAKISAGAGWGEEWAPLQTYRGSRRRMRLSVVHRRTRLPRRRAAPPSPASTPPGSLPLLSDTPPRTPVTRRTRQSTRKPPEHSSVEDARQKETSSSKLSGISRPDSTSDASDVGYANVTTRKRRRESPDGLTADDGLGFRGFDPPLLDSSGPSLSADASGSGQNGKLSEESKAVRSRAGVAKRPRRVGVASLAAADSDQDSLDSNSGGDRSGGARACASPSTGIHSYDSDNP
ncbi:hypothetical protein MSG28_005410 [Choristoneura fumiferana]|uniref:Uncharacterized protein n=1 Tax=Choristoneura fumiferana TaxID=7141 RepID=A0ACC0JRL1_CHOFU|nr:hypothetical protein MSG28_005410 [Choristoneura fumiferana]